MYGTDETVMPRHALHCAETVFTHPITGEEIRLRSPLPEDMLACLHAHNLEVAL